MGANVQPGQDVVLVYLVEHVPIARAVTRAALERRPPGRHDHHRPPSEEGGDRARPGGGAQADTRPRARLVRTWSEARPAIIQLTGEPEPDLFGGLDQRLVARRPTRATSGLCLPLVTRQLLDWVIVPAPNAGWAEVVLEQDVEGLWSAVATTLRLDDDPVAAWQARDVAGEACRSARRGRVRRRALSWPGHRPRRRPARVVALAVRDVQETETGIKHIPNLPTKRSSRRPDLRRTKGIVQVDALPTRRARLVGARVDGLRDTFRGRQGRRRPRRGRGRRGDPLAARLRRTGAVPR